MAEGPQEVSIPLVWVGAEEHPVYLANQFVCQFNQDEFILTFGQMVPPAILGTEEEKAQQAEQISYVPVKPLARLALTRSRTRELIAVLEANLQNYEQYLEQIRGGDQQWPS